LIGEACLQLKKSGKLDPTHPKHYHYVAFSAAARQIAAAIIANNIGF
jgi:hypothetical protein